MSVSHKVISFQRTLRIDISIKKIISTLILAVSFMGKINGKYVPWYFPYAIISPIVIIYSIDYFNNATEEIKKVGKSIIYLSLVPYFVAMVYSAILTVAHVNIINSNMRALSITLQEAFIVFFVIITFNYFRNETLEIMINASIISYFISFANAIYNVGVEGFIRYVANLTGRETYLNKWFENHGIGLSVGLLLLYEIAFCHRKSIFKIVVMTSILVLCWKRIALLGVAGVLILFGLTNGKTKLISKIILQIVLSGIIFSCFLYVMLLSSGRLYYYAAEIGLDFSNRKFLYDFISRFYEWSFSFCGHGLGFTGKYLQSIAHTNRGLAIMNMQAIHSDILKTYIDLGFWGSMFWFGWYIWVAPKKMYVLGGSISKYVYCLVTFYVYITYATDNTSAYYIFRILMYSLFVWGGYQGLLSKKKKI